MTGVWQALLPSQTPSTEPISIIIDDVQNSSTSNENHNEHRNSTGNHLLSVPVPVSTKHRNLSGGSNNNNTSSLAALHDRNYLEYNNVSHNPGTNASTRTSSSSKIRAFQRFISSFNCGEQFWRFYSDWAERRRRRQQDGGQSTANKERFFLKSGVYNTRHVNVFEKTRRYIKDVFTTLVDARWRWTLLVFSVSYIVSWIGFAVIWWLIVFAHGDLEHWNDPEWQPCIVGLRNFASVFLFSLETQHTIGYGTRYMNDTCPDAIIILVAQSVAGVLIEAFMVGVVFAKLSRPKKRSNTLLFSKNAVICQRDGQLYFMFRVGDMRARSGLLECHVRAQVITKRVTREGELLPTHQQEIKVGGYGEDEERILLFWPTIIVHRIDSESPFYRMSPLDLLKAKLEVVVVLEGVVETTGMTTQLRTSFLPSEILWGHRFQELSSFKAEQRIFDFKLFNATFPVDTPQISSYELDNLAGEVHSLGSLNGAETLPVSPQRSLDHTSDDDNSSMNRQKQSLEVAAIINGGMYPSTGRLIAPLEYFEDDDEDIDNFKTINRRESTSSLDSVIVNDMKV